MVLRLIIISLLMFVVADYTLMLIYYIYILISDLVSISTLDCDDRGHNTQHTLMHIYLSTVVV